MDGVSYTGSCLIILFSLSRSLATFYIPIDLLLPSPQQPCLTSKCWHATVEWSSFFHVSLCRLHCRITTLCANRWLHSISVAVSLWIDLHFGWYE